LIFERTRLVRLVAIPLPGEEHLAGDLPGNVVDPIDVWVEIDDDGLAEIKIKGEQIASSTLQYEDPLPLTPLPGRFPFCLSDNLVIRDLLPSIPSAFPGSVLHLNDLVAPLERYFHASAAKPWPPRHETVQ